MRGLGGTGRVADDLYLMAHDEVTGKGLLSPRATGLGLAGGLLAELALAGALQVTPLGLAVTGFGPPGDDLAGSVLGVVAGEPGQPSVRDWLAFLGRTATGEVAGRLAGSGYLVSAQDWRGQRWVPVDPDCAFAPVGAGPAPPVDMSGRSAGRAGRRVRPGVAAGAISPR